MCTGSRATDFFRFKKWCAVTAGMSFFLMNSKGWNLVGSLCFFISKFESYCVSALPLVAVRVTVKVFTVVIVSIRGTTKIGCYGSG